MMRIFFFLAGLLGAGSFGVIWEKTGPSSDPNGKPTGQGLLRGDDGIG
ncbi:MAG TPA: hypothetical protein VNM67_00025 [Thermoanaerobaculia bacterium]|jgi:hypothetical protein|nr:hypothetical protein [Thermoanaerobaculia bacterium]